jgi:Circularly permutated YpsA SLOG family
MKPIPKIVSGGQTGADRAGLDWALKHNLPVADGVQRAGRQKMAQLTPSIL